MIPLFVDFSGKRVVVVGGSNAAYATARPFFLEADVIAVDTSFCPEFEDADCSLRRERVTARNATDVIEGATLVVAADEPEVNDEIEAACEETGSLVVRLDRGGSAFVPRTVEKGSATVGIHVGDGTFAETELGWRVRSLVETADAMARLESELAERLTTGVDYESRLDVLRAVVEDDEIWAALEEDEQAARRLAYERAGLDP